MIDNSDSPTSISLTDLQPKTRHTFLLAGKAISRAEQLRSGFERNHPHAYTLRVESFDYQDKLVTVDGADNQQPRIDGSAATAALGAVVTGANGVLGLGAANAAGQLYESAATGESLTEVKMPLLPNLDVRPGSSGTEAPLAAAIFVAGIAFATVAVAVKGAGSVKVQADALRTQKAYDAAAAAAVERAESALLQEPEVTNLDVGQLAAASNHLLERATFVADVNRTASFTL